MAINLAVNGFTKRSAPVSRDAFNGRQSLHLVPLPAILLTDILCPLAPVLPHLHNEEIDSAIPPVEVTKVCLRLRHLVQECVPCEMEESRITAPHSRIITPHVIRAAKEAGGQEHKGCVVRDGCIYYTAQP